MEKQAGPTAIIQADAATFKDLVQKLTGAPGGSAQKLRSKPNVSRLSPYKLQQRRKQSLRDLEIVKFGMESNGNSRGKTQAHAVFSPVKGPTTPSWCDSVSWERERTESPPSEEERAIAEKGFYLHASPEKAEPPVLLTLFPLISPRKEF